jgi:class 3 adenylate cyclase/CheY-like chemotaxis protein
MSGEKELIMLVDDNPANLRAGKNVLSEKYTVFTAPSADKMFSLLDTNRPALILLDVEMPEMNGYEAIRILKAKPETRDIPVVFLTGKNETENELEGLSLGAIDYIAKPFIPLLLLKRIEAHLLVESQKKTMEAQQQELKYYAGNLQKILTGYLSSNVVDEILSDPTRMQLGGTKRNMTVVFTDIKNFTRVSENMDPVDLVRLLNNYLTGMSDIILEQMGTIDKYIGDAIMAFFGAPLDLPDHAKRSCTAALLMKRKEKELNEQFIRSGLSSLPLETRIGINTGSMNVGNMGSERKMNYTVIGNEVNIAARLEAANKFFGTWILTSEHTVQSAGDDFLFRRLDRLLVKGIQVPLRIFELVESSADATEKQRETVAIFHEALDLFENREWVSARERFKQVLEVAGEDKPSRLYLDRCELYRVQPPSANWNAVVFDLTGD